MSTPPADALPKKKISNKAKVQTPETTTSAEIASDEGEAKQKYAHGRESRLNENQLFFSRRVWPD